MTYKRGDLVEFKWIGYDANLRVVDFFPLGIVLKKPTDNFVKIYDFRTKTIKMVVKGMITRKFK